MFEARRITNGKLSSGSGNETQLLKIDPEFLREERREDTFKKKHRSLTGWWNLENESSLSKR